MAIGGEGAGNAAPGQSEGTTDVAASVAATMSRKKAAALKEALGDFPNRGRYLDELHDTLDADLNADGDRRRRLVLGAHHLTALALYDTLSPPVDSPPTGSPFTDREFHKRYGLRIIPLTGE